MQLVEQVLRTLPEHMTSSPVFNVARHLSFYVVFCTPLFVLFILDIELSVFLQIMSSDYRFRISKLFSKNKRYNDQQIQRDEVTNNDQQIQRDKVTNNDQQIQRDKVTNNDQQLQRDKVTNNDQQIQRDKVTNNDQQIQRDKVTNNDQHIQRDKVTNNDQHNTTQISNVLATRTPLKDKCRATLKTGDEVMCSGRVSSTCSTSCIDHVTFVTISMICCGF
jgi:hypothetical protein